MFVSINDKEMLKESINGESVANGWKEIKIDISDLAGMEIYAEIRQEFNGSEKSTAYWHELKIISE